MLTVNSNYLHNNIRYLTKTFIENLKADYEIILKKDINAKIDEDIEEKLVTFSNVINNNSNNRVVALRKIAKRETTVSTDNNKSEFGMKKTFFFFTKEV